MMSGGRAVENDFMKYLSERVTPAQLSELYRYYSEILYIIFDYSHKHYTFKQFEV